MSFAFHPKDFLDAVYAKRGVLTADQTAAHFCTTNGVVRGIWRRVTRRLGGITSLRGAPKHARELVEFLYSQRGLKSSRILAAEFGLNRNIIIGLWNRERARRGDPITPRGTSPRQHLPRIRNRQRLTPRAVGNGTTGAKIKKITKVESKHAGSRKLNPFATLYGKTNKTPKQQSFSIREVEAMPVNNGQGVSFMELPPGGCKFALGEWDAKAEFFCGSPVMVGCSYCAPHYAVCHAPTRHDLERLAA